VAPTARECSFCAAELLVKACPRCFARVFHGAKHCNHCGAHVSVAAHVTEDGEAAARRCPACADGTVLRGRLAGDILLDECPGCHGIFLDAAALERIIQEREGHSVEAVAGVAAGGAETIELPPPNPRGRAMYIKCPDCENVMNRRNFGKSSGIIVDVCRAHGTWFDANELPLVIAFVASGGLDKTRARERARLEEETRRAQTAARINIMRHASEPVAIGNVTAFEGLLSSIGKVLRNL
jgi:Zn-finger nucleic acid-binding protein